MNIQLKKIRDEEMKMAHIDGHNHRLAFIDDVMGRYDEDDFTFMDLVNRQLSLWCDGYVDPRVFCNVCNDSRHRIRNKLITWEIDHRKDK